MNLDKHYLWCEKYRPQTLKDYAFHDKSHQATFQQIVDDQALSGHLLLTGIQGTGKTTLAQILINELKIDEMDLLVMHASDENSVDDMRGKIKTFIQTFPVGDFKLVLLEEADYISHNGQAVLRKLLEDENNPARFILTCNYENKIMPAIKSRCQHYRFTAPDRDNVTETVAKILLKEQVRFDLDLLDMYVAVGYPDIRKIINTLQQSSSDNKLLPLVNEHTSGDFKFELLPLIEKGDWVGCRKLLCANVSADEWEGVYRFLYENISRCESFKDPVKWESAIITVAEYLYKHAIVSDPEINAVAMLATLSQI